MSDRELKLFQDLQEEDNISRSMLHLSAAAIPSECTAACTCSAKRQSSWSPTSFQEPSSKRAATLHSSSPPDNHLLGFAKLTLPQPFPSISPPSLRRTVSDPVHSADAINSSAPAPHISESTPSPGSVFTNQPPENSHRNIPKESVPFDANAAPIIHRTVSDPNPIANRRGVTPPRPPVGRNVSSSPSCNESPSTKRLKRMKERLREMSQWWNQVVSEGDEENGENENYNNEHIAKEESKSEMDNPPQEAVWVEKNGECLVLHFKCPCGNGYQILLSGRNCYYKLTHF